MIRVHYKKENKQFNASFVDKEGYKIKFGPYPNKNSMKQGIREYMKLSKTNLYSISTGFF